MNVISITKTMNEIFVDNIPIGIVISNINKEIERVEIYDNHIFTLQDAEMLKEFISKIIDEYQWVDSE